MKFRAIAGSLALDPDNPRPATAAATIGLRLKAG